MRIKFTLVIAFFVIAASCNGCSTIMNEEVDQDHFTLMTYNISAPNSSFFPFSKQMELVNIILQNKPDILCFQELSFENLKRIKPQLDSLYGSCETLKGDNQLWRLRLYSHFPIRNFSRHHCTGEINMDKMTEEEIAEVELYRKQMNVMSAEFEVEPDRWISVYSGHLRSNAYSTARRAMGTSTNWIKGLPLYLRNYQIGKSIRNFEAQNIKRFVEEERREGKTVIVAGDFNDWCGSKCLKTLMGNDLKDAWNEGGRGFGWTFFGWNLRLRLDHILYSDELELVDVKVIDSDLSDHKPLMARFKVK